MQRRLTTARTQRKTRANLFERMATDDNPCQPASVLIARRIEPIASRSGICWAGFGNRPARGREPASERCAHLLLVASLSTGAFSRVLGGPVFSLQRAASYSARRACGMDRRTWSAGFTQHSSSKTEVTCVARPVANVPCDILLASACRLLVHGLPPLPGERAVFSVPRRRATPRPATQTGLRCDTFFKACVGVSDRPRKTSPADSAAEKDQH